MISKKKNFLFPFLHFLEICMHDACIMDASCLLRGSNTRPFPYEGNATTN